MREIIHQLGSVISDQTMKEHTLYVLALRWLSALKSPSKVSLLEKSRNSTL